jgi:hypothetical protein
MTRPCKAKRAASQLRGVTIGGSRIVVEYERPAASSAHGWARSSRHDSFDKAHRFVSYLAKDFRAHEHKYLSLEYQEAEARKEFIDKFWKVLGWEVDHEVQKNPYEQQPVRTTRRPPKSLVIKNGTSGKLAASVSPVKNTSMYERRIKG